MNHSSSNRGFPAGNPIANALVVLVGALAVGASIVLGFFAFIALSALVIVFAAIIGVRVWWFKRKLRKAARDSGNMGSERPGSVDVIEGEFRVVDRRADESSSGNEQP